MYETIEEYKRKFSLAESLSDYRFVVSIQDGNLDSLVLKMSLSDFWQEYDNGDPRLSIIPHNISTRFHYWLRNTIYPEMSKVLDDGIFNKDWKKSDVDDCFDKYAEICQDWLRKEISESKIAILKDGIEEKINMEEFAKKITCIASEKSI